MVDFALKSDPPAKTLAKELEYPDAPNTDYNLKQVNPDMEAINARIISQEAKDRVNAHIESLHKNALAGYYITLLYCI